MIVAYLLWPLQPTSAIVWTQLIKGMNKDLCGNIMLAALRTEQWCHFQKLQGKFLFISAARSYHLLLSTVCAECHVIKRNMFSAATDAEHGIILLVSKYQSGLENGSVTNAKSWELLKELSDRNVSCKKSASLRHQTFQVCHLKPFLSFSFSSENFFC